MVKEIHMFSRSRITVKKMHCSDSDEEDNGP
jgi:hypothetical protein